MKWTKENDSELIRLISIGKRHDEIKTELNTSIRSITNRCTRLRLKVNYHKEYKCEQCGNLFISYISIERKFCSKSCSATFNNLNSVKSEETKEKISKKLIGKRYKTKKSIIKKEKNEKIIKKYGSLKRKCKYCGNYKIDKKHKAICDDCRVEYYEAYRPSCEFKFDINKYKDKFDFKLVEQYGWYSPSNKGNNLNGVSRDHLYSVRDGFINKVDCEIINHPANCGLLKHTENSSKHDYSCISLEELKERIKKWIKTK